MMQQREREIRRMVSELGMEITSFRTDGGGHWRVDVKSPNGRQRPFTFPAATSGNWRSLKNEVAMLRRWRREVMPELDAAEEAGTLEPPPSMRSQLAEKLANAGIPLRVEPSPEPGKVVTQHEVLHVPTTPPFKIKTPEAALASTFTQEKPMSAIQTAAPPPAPTAAPSPPSAAKRKQVNLSPVRHVMLADWMRAPGRLDDPMTQDQCAARATKELGFLVTRAHVGNILEGFGLELKKVPRRDVGTPHRTRVQVIAESVVKLLEKEGMDVPLDLLAVALGERDIRTVTEQSHH